MSLSLPNKLSEDRLRQMLVRIFQDESLGREGESAEQILQQQAAAGYLTVPGGTVVSVVFDRFPVLADLQRPGRRSVLCDILMDRADETILVADSVLPGGKALFLARMASHKGQVLEWLDRQTWSRCSAIIRSIEHEEKVLMVSSLSAFVLSSSEPAD